MAVLTQTPTFCLPLRLVHPLGIPVLTFKLPRGFCLHLQAQGLRTCLHSGSVPDQSFAGPLHLESPAPQSGACGPLGTAAPHPPPTKDPLPGFALTVTHPQGTDVLLIFLRLLVAECFSKMNQEGGVFETELWGSGAASLRSSGQNCLQSLGSLLVTSSQHWHMTFPPLPLRTSP